MLNDLVVKLHYHYRDVDILLEHEQSSKHMSVHILRITLSFIALIH